jgi:hypothetical protein
LDLSERVALDVAAWPTGAWTDTLTAAQRAVPSDGASANQMAAQAVAGLGAEDENRDLACQSVAFVYGFLAEGNDPKEASRPHQVGSVISARFALGRDATGNLLICTLIRDIFGNPYQKVKFDKKWRTDTAVTLARTMYEAREFSAMPILADALQDAGCDSDDILAHCRDPKQVHVRGCWVVDLVLGKK